jgi:hypothetical protein
VADEERTKGGTKCNAELEYGRSAGLAALLSWRLRLFGRSGVLGAIRAGWSSVPSFVGSLVRCCGWSASVGDDARWLAGVPVGLQPRTSVPSVFCVLSVSLGVVLVRVTRLAPSPIVLAARWVRWARSGRGASLARRSSAHSQVFGRAWASVVGSRAGALSSCHVPRGFRSAQGRIRRPSGFVVVRNVASGVSPVAFRGFSVGVSTLWLEWSCPRRLAALVGLGPALPLVS